MNPGCFSPFRLGLVILCALFLAACGSGSGGSDGNAGGGSSVSGGTSSGSSNSGGSNSGGSTSGTSAPTPPMGLTATASSGQVALTWSASTGATSYTVSRSTTTGGPYVNIASPGTASYTDTAVTSGATYYYVVSATNSTGTSANSPEAGATLMSTPLMSAPAAPTGLVATAGNAQVALTWTASSGATSYKINRSTTNGGPYTNIATVTTSSYTDSAVTNGTTYYYVVTASNSAGQGPPSIQSAATPAMPTVVPAAPASVNAVDGASHVTVSWAAVSGATSYNVYRSTTQGARGTLVGSTSSTNLSDSTVVGGTTYYFVVTASNAAGEGAASAAASVKHANSWSNVKYGGGGYVTGLVFHPTTRDLLYSRTDVGGAYRWDASTSSWIPITDGLGVADSFWHGVESIALDPNNDQMVYMVTGMYNSADATARLYISGDRGSSWTSVNLPFSAGSNNNGRGMGERLMVDPNKPSILFFGSRTAGLWKSADSGRTWAQVTSLSSTKLTADQLNTLGGNAMGVELVVYDTSTKGTGTATATLYVAIAPDYVNLAGLGSNLYKSTDGGASWTPVTTPVSGYHIPHMVRAADGLFYVPFTKGAGPGDGGPARLYKFDGSTWTLLDSTNSAGYGGVAVFGTGATTRIALGVSGTWGNYSGQQIVQLSDDDGATWREIEGGMPGQTASGWVDDVVIDPSNRDHIMHVHGGGIVETRSASSATPTWNFAVNGLEETCTLALNTPPAGASYTLLTGSGDVGTWVYTDLTKAPTLNPYKQWSSGNSIDTAWSDSTYIVASNVINSSSTGTGYWSGDSGNSWTSFASLPAGVAANTAGATNIVATARNKLVWAPADSVPSYSTDNGATWTATNLPALSVISGVPRSYRLVADRQNPNKVYAYDSGGAWWGTTAGKVYVSTDGGHTFALSQGSVALNLRANPFNVTSMAVNPNVEGDLWLADGNTIYHSLDSGATWTTFNNFASVWGTRQTWQWPVVQGASNVALGKAKAGAAYSAAVYVMGTINGVWGFYRSDDGGATWTRFNDDGHQFGGPNVMAADQNLYGRIYLGGSCRGVLYSN